MFSTWIGVLLLFGFFGLVALVVVGASPRGTNYEKKRAKARTEKLEAMHDQTNNALTTYGWVDKTKGVVRIPINDAMKLTVAELSQKKPAPANPIATTEAQSPAPQSPTAPPTAPSPSASATGTPKPTSITGPNSENRNQPAAASNPPPAPPGTQPGPSTAPAASPPSAPAKAAISPSTTPSPSAPGTPLPVRGKTP
jgi:FtsZ-interacting cell division protein ZipA